MIFVYLFVLGLAIVIFHDFWRKKQKAEASEVRTRSYMLRMSLTLGGRRERTKHLCHPESDYELGRCLHRGFGAGLPVDAIGVDGDVDGPVGLFVEVRAFGLVFVVGLVGVGEVHVAGAEHLEAVVEVCSGREHLSAEAGAGIINFEQQNRLAGVVADGRQHVGRVTSGEGERGRRGRRGCGADAWLQG